MAAGDPVRYSVIIAGGGPAGLATALYLAQRAPQIAADMLILEAAEHPRPKLCGGGVTFHGEEQLRRLNLRLDVPFFTINRLLFRLGAQSFCTECPNAMRIIQREAFDAALARAVADRGLRLQLNEKVLDVQPAADGVTLVTNRGHYHTAVLIGADGANSIVRRRLHLPHTPGVARLLRIMTPVDPQRSAIWRQQTAVFDFSCVADGIQGYVWDFPCYVDGQATMNRGVFDSRIDVRPDRQKKRDSLRQTFAAGLAEQNVQLADFPLEGHPVRWFNPAADFSRPRVLLVGDAAGVDALFAEGISYGMEYGEIAATAVVEAFASGDFSFTGYRRQLLNHRLGRQLTRRATIARKLYRYHYPLLWALLWRMAAISPRRVQRLIGSSLGLLPP